MQAKGQFPLCRVEELNSHLYFEYLIELRNKKEQLPLVELEEDMSLNPNPSLGYVNLRMKEMPEDNYSIEVYNIIGIKLWEYKFSNYNEYSFDFNLSFLKKGTYIYSIKDSNGRRLNTKRLTIITP